jgi:hypothetical protein
VRAAAVQLFLERASAARSGRDMAVAPVVAVARICRDLDGLPAGDRTRRRARAVGARDRGRLTADMFRFLAAGARFPEHAARR